MYDLIESVGPIEENTAKGLFKQCLNGINYIHSRGFYHRDIKLENFFVMEDGTVKLGDFGSLARIRKTFEDGESDGCWGSEIY